MQKRRQVNRRRRKPGSGKLNFNLKTKKNPLKVWLRVAFIFWPVISVLFNILPAIKKIIINKFLGKAENVYGKVESIHLEWFKPGFLIKDIHFNKVSAPAGHSMECSAESIKVSLDWNALWEGVLICNALVHRFNFYFSKNKKSPEDKEDEKTKSKQFKIPVPVLIRQFNITDSRIEFNDTTLKVNVDVVINNIRARITNLSNMDSSTELPVKAFLRANIYKGVLNAHLKADVLGAVPAYDLDAELTGVDMVKLNDFFKAYGNFDVNDGTLSFFTEIAVKDGKYKGYIKPVIRNLDIFGEEDKQDSFLQQMWERLVGAAAAIITNRQQGQLATKIPIEGEYKPEVNIAYSILEIFVNAFVHALKPAIDNTIDIGSVKGR